MNRGQRGSLRVIARAAVVAVLGLGLMGCSSTLDAMDPTGWFGPDSPDLPPATAQTSQPDLGSIPDKPDANSTSDDRQQVASSLGQARDNVEYSAQELRGGTEAAAPAPNAAQGAMTAAEPAAPDVAPAAVTRNSPSTPAANPVLSAGTEAAPAPAETQAPVKKTARVATASQTGAPVAPPALAESPAKSPLIVPQGTEPAFAESKAPALDSGIANYVPPSIIARYAQNAPVGQQALALADRPVHLKAPPGTRKLKLGTGTSDVGGPEAMSGAVVANLGVLPVPNAQTSTFAGISNATVRFSRAGTALTREGRAAVTTMAQAFAARGSQGFVHITAYGGAGRPAIAFARAQTRARAVAAALIRAGVPAEKLLIDTQGDAPDGFAARADIALQ